VANRNKVAGSNRLKKPMEEGIERINIEKLEKNSSHEQEKNHEEVKGEKRT